MDAVELAADVGPGVTVESISGIPGQATFLASRLHGDGAASASAAGAVIRPRVDILLYRTDAFGHRSVFLPVRNGQPLQGADLPLIGLDREPTVTLEDSAVLAGFTQLGLRLDVERFKSLAGPDIEMVIAGDPDKHFVRVLAYEVNDVELRAMQSHPDFVGVDRWVALDEARNTDAPIHPALREVLERLWFALEMASQFGLAVDDPRRYIYEAKHRGDHGELIARTTLILVSEHAEPVPEPDPANKVACLVHNCQRLGDHWHPYNEMFVLLQGRVVVFTAPKDDPENISGPFVYEAGRSFTIPKEVIHTVFCDPGTILSAVVTWDVGPGFRENIVASRLRIPGIDYEVEAVAVPERGFISADDLGGLVPGQFSTDAALSGLRRIYVRRLPAQEYEGVRARPRVCINLLPVHPKTGRVLLGHRGREPMPGLWYFGGAMGFGLFEEWAANHAYTHLFGLHEDDEVPEQLMVYDRQLTLLPGSPINLMWPRQAENPLRPCQDIDVATFALLLTEPQLAGVQPNDEFVWVEWFDPRDALEDDDLHPAMREVMRRYLAAS